MVSFACTSDVNTIEMEVYRKVSAVSTRMVVESASPTVSSFHRKDTPQGRFLHKVGERQRHTSACRAATRPKGLQAGNSGENVFAKGRVKTGKGAGEARHLRVRDLTQRLPACIV
jgi:hypothetical protein